MCGSQDEGGTSMSNHLNDFNTMYSNLVAQEVEFLDSVKALFLLITLPDSWDTFGQPLVTPHHQVA